jgi:hypothetical protein
MAPSHWYYAVGSEENNPMYRLNEKLGFCYNHAWLGYEKEVEA